jgi:hypothetical protein
MRVIEGVGSGKEKTDCHSSVDRKGLIVLYSGLQKQCPAGHVLQHERKVQ